MLRSIAANTCAGARIDAGNEGIRVQPLDRAGLGDTGNRIVLIQGRTRNYAGKLGTAAIDDAISICRIRRAEDGERQTAAPKDRPGHLPSIQHRPQAAAQLDRQLIDITRGEILPYVVVAGASVAS